MVSGRQRRHNSPLVRQGCAPDGPVRQEINVSDDDRDGGNKRHQWIRTIAVIAKLLLWILWVTFDPRHPD